MHGLKRVTVTLPVPLASELEDLRLTNRISASSVAEIALRAFLNTQSKDAAVNTLRAAGATLRRRGRSSRRRPIIGAEEQRRLARLREFDVLDTPPDGAYDGITTLAARIFNVPVALVSVVDEDRIWFKSRFGLDGIQEIPRDPGLCSSAILDDEVYVVENARIDPRTLANPLVAGSFGLQFYAAAPLITSDGFRLGTVCILDRKPRVLSRVEEQLLQTLATLVMNDLEIRLKAMRAVLAERNSRPLN